MLRILHRDYETKSTLDLRKVGAHVYAQHPTTDIILACFAFDDDEWPLIWLAGEELPAEVRAHIEAGGAVHGHNAAFEACIDTYIMGPRYDWPVPKLEQLDCTLARCAVQALPLDLDLACQALGLREKKDKEGHKLMRRMCRPRSVNKSDDGRPAYTWWDSDPAKLARLAEYCQQDVRAERELDKALRPLTPEERQVWLFTERMNWRGVRVDLPFVERARELVQAGAEKLDAELREATGGQVTKATQVDKLKEFLKSQGVELRIDIKTRRNGEEYEAEAADKEAIEDLLAQDDLPQAARTACEIRLAAGKASVKKLDKFKEWTAADGRARHNLQYHAAGPGRWAGRGIQLQNLPRRGVTEPGGWAAAHRDMLECDLGLFELMWGSPLDVCSRMLRGAVIAAPDHKLIFGDYSQIEARAAAWLSGQHDQVEAFARGEPIYEQMGAFIFGLSVEEVLRLYDTREDIVPRVCGKGTVLGCQYGLGPPKFQATIKKQSRVLLPLKTAQKAVGGWREKNWRTVEYWREFEDACRHAIEAPGRVFWCKPFAFRVLDGGRWLQMRLPSNRVLWYRRPTIEPAAADLEALDAGEELPRYRWKIHYWGVNSYTKQWAKETTWGGKLLENGVQGMCRDLLANAQLNHEAAGYTPVLSVHDEAISEVPNGQLTDEQMKLEFLSIMTDIPAWAKGLPVKAEGGVGVRYAK